MGLIKNYDQLSKSPQRKVVLDLVQAALDSIQPEKVIKQKVTLLGGKLKIEDQQLDIEKYRKIILLGFGKGSAKNAKILEGILGSIITNGFVIDTNPEDFEKIEFTQGTHPLPSMANIDFSQKIIQNLSNLTEKDLVLIITCGGGSVMLESPHKLTLGQMINVNRELLHSGATIQEVNKVRKHLDIVKGGGLAKILYPATVFNLIFSDVPGNDLATIASGPTVKDPSTENDTAQVLEKYNLGEKLSFVLDKLVESPKDDKYFEKVENILLLSNDTALEAMRQKAAKLGLSATIYSNSFQKNATEAGKILAKNTPRGTILLAGGETNVVVTGNGQGGRNQQLVLSTLSNLDKNTIICSFDSDGWDNSPSAGALGDFKTLEAAKSAKLDLNSYSKNNDAFTFFNKVGDAILTDRLPSNVSDLMIVYKYG